MEVEVTNSADRIGLERQLRIPSSREQSGQRTTTVAADSDTEILDMKGAAELLHVTPGFLSKIINGKSVTRPMGDMKECLYARRPNYRRSRARVALF
jgi:hypothetical protein